MLETLFSCTYARELQHNSLALIQSLHYDRLAIHKSTQNTLYIHASIIENTDNDVLDT